MPEIVALVPLRGGSKSIPDKNIRVIAGKPLCAWVLETACASGVFSKVVVSTDSEKIAEVVNNLIIPVEIIQRPLEFATDEASTESVMLHAATVLDFEVLVTIQATSPLVTPDDFIGALKKFRDGGFDSMLTAVRSKRFFWHDDGTPLNYQPASRPRRQDFSGTLMENGAFYITKRSILNKYACRLGGKIGIYEMPPESAIELDEPSDWPLVGQILKKQKYLQIVKSLSAIKLLVVDVDGTLTDAGMYWSERGEQLKKFNTRDAKGLELVRKLGVTVAIITSENSLIVIARAKKLGINHCYVGVENKKSCLLELLDVLGVTVHETAYIGDDINDLECLGMVGFSACPADAVTQVKKSVSYICEESGGMGAVREVCNMISDELSNLQFQDY